MASIAQEGDGGLVIVPALQFIHYRLLEALYSLGLTVLTMHKLPFLYLVHLR
jgi:hypothetical protein